MSQESAKLFIEKVMSDDNFRHRLVTAENETVRISLVKSAGFKFTQEEFNEIAGEFDMSTVFGTSGPDANGWIWSNDGEKK